jgi:hypothetical protein
VNVLMPPELPRHHSKNRTRSTVTTSFQENYFDGICP